MTADLERPRCFEAIECGASDIVYCVFVRVDGASTPSDALVLMDHGTGLVDRCSLCDLVTGAKFRRSLKPGTLASDLRMSISITFVST